jgi:hypothetical protein
VVRTGAAVVKHLRKKRRPGFEVMAARAECNLPRGWKGAFGGGSNGFGDPGPMQSRDERETRDEEGTADKGETGDDRAGGDLVERGNWGESSGHNER